VAAKDVVADAIRSSDSGSGRDADTAIRANATDACAANPGAPSFDLKGPRKERVAERSDRHRDSLQCRRIARSETIWG
jgi:hypothetical protein